jgi:hypothetical protein
MESIAPNGGSYFYDIHFNGAINDISTTTFSYLSGVSSNIQNQFNNLSNSISSINTSTKFY